MTLTANKNKFLLVRSFLFSIFIHIIVFNMFIFTFPVQSPQKKPEFIFLGSILHSVDLYSHLRDPSRKSSITKNMINQIDTPEIDTKNPFSNNKTLSKKPTLIKIKNQKQKQTQKITFLDKTDSSLHSSNENVGVDLQLKPYQPLELKPK